jgi:hypothetical protein
MVTDSKGEFAFGNCASVAIAGAFGLRVMDVCEVFERMGFDWVEGVSFNECQKTIYFLGRTLRRKVVYRKNRIKGSYSSFAKVLADGGIYIMHFDEHLSLLENGVVYDSYFKGMDGKKKFEKWMPNGWWVIKDVKL